MKQFNEILKETLGQLAGAASLCWESRPTGVFDPATAQKFVDEAVEKLQAVHESQEKKIKVMREALEKIKWSCENDFGREVHSLTCETLALSEGE